MLEFYCNFLPCHGFCSSLKAASWSKHTHAACDRAASAGGVCMWVVWVHNIQQGWHPLEAKMDYRSWLPSSCGSGPLPSGGNSKRKSSSVFACISPCPHQKYTISILCWCCSGLAFCMLCYNIVQKWIFKFQGLISLLLISLCRGGLPWCPVFIVFSAFIFFLYSF